MCDPSGERHRQEVTGTAAREIRFLSVTFTVAIRGTGIADTSCNRTAQLRASIMETLRLAARLLRRNPLFSAATILILAAGIGANSAMFSIVSGVLLRPLPFADPDRLVLVGETRADALGDARASLATFLAWRAGQPSVALAAYIDTEFRLTGGQPILARGSAVSANFFALLGEPLYHGRSFESDDDRPTAARTLILSYTLWQTRFAGDPAMVGRSIRIDDNTYTVIGIARPAFDFPEGASFWTPIQPEIGEEHLHIVQAKFARVLGRLQPGVSPERARAQLSAIAAALPDNEGWSARVLPLHPFLTAGVQTPLLILMAAVLFVLLIACANVGNLLLARGAARAHELSIRAALGASRARIARELLAESLLLSAAAGALGVLAALWCLDLVLRLSPTELPRLAHVSIDARVLAFTVVISLITGLITGAFPVLRSRSRDLTPTLKEGGHQATTGRARGRVRAALVIAEVALSVVLLIGAGLLLRSFLAIVAVDPGFRPEHVTTFDLTLPHYKYDVMGHRAFSAQLVTRVKAIPGVTSAAIVHNLPISGRRMMGPVQVENRERDPTRPPAHVGFISPGYFQTMGIRLLSGRDFEPRDADRGWVAIVNEAFVRAYFPNEDPIGKKARTLFGPPNMKEIVGVVADVRQIGLTQPPEPVFYTYSAQDISSSFTLVVRATIPAQSAMAAVRNVLRSMDPDLPFGTVATMQDLIARSVAQPRFYATLLGCFSVLAVTLAMLGLYAVLSQSVAQRSHEIGIRMALGARAADIVRLMLDQGLRLTLMGAAIGVAGALAATRVLARLLFGVQPVDAVTFVSVTGLLLGAAILAMTWPARRAARLQPVTSLRR
jgi:predicted permease